MQASDPDGDSITFQITGGSDQSSFTINNSGQVLFLSSPDYENPSDANFDNSYEVVIRAFDGSLYSSNYDFIVNITMMKVTMVIIHLPYVAINQNLLYIAQ